MAVRRSCRAYAAYVRAIAESLHGLLADLPLPAEREVDVDLDVAYPPALFPAAHLAGGLEALTHDLSHLAWRLERLALGRSDEPTAEEKRLADTMRPLWPAVAPPAVRDPAAAAVREVFACTALLQAGWVALRTARERLVRRAREKQASKTARRQASAMAVDLAGLIDAAVKPAFDRLRTSGVAKRGSSSSQPSLNPAEPTQPGTPRRSRTPRTKRRGGAA
jgi:hypothetical protein